MSDKEQLKQQLKELMKESLELQVKSTSSLGSDTDRLVVVAIFDGEEVASGSIDMRQLPMW